MVRTNHTKLGILIALFSIATLLTSCASGKYYKAGEDYQDHPERYTKDSQQTFNDPYYNRNSNYSYHQENRVTHNKCNKKKK
jgi:PBP1b-binding outer membrane lipoprotein LpoB